MMTSTEKKKMTMMKTNNGHDQHIHVYVAPLEYDIIVNKIKKHVDGLMANNNGGEEPPSSIEEYFEAFLNATVFEADEGSSSPAEVIFRTKKGRKEILPLLVSISEAMPELFSYNIVTKRLISILNKLCVAPPPPRKHVTASGDDEDDDGDEDDETVIDQCASIISNTSGDVSRTHAAQIFRFFSSSSSSGRNTKTPMSEFELHYGPSFVTVMTASVLWPGATAFAALLIFAANNNHKNNTKTPQQQQQNTPLNSLTKELFENCLSSSSTKKEIMEIGCGLGLLSTALASCFSFFTANDEPNNNKTVLKLTDLFESSAKNATQNVSSALAKRSTNNNNIDVKYEGLDWRTYVEENDNEPESEKKERIIIGSEVFFDEDMSRDVATLIGTKIVKNFKVAYLVVLEKRAGFTNFPKYCADQNLNCEIFSYSEFFKPQGFKVTTEVEIGSGENSVGKACLDDWAFMKLTKKKLV